MLKLCFLLSALVLLAGCAATPNADSGKSDLTQGAVQLHLKKGETTQAEVLEKFGAPNITTLDGQGQEVWTYQRHATVGKSSGSYATIVILGTGTSGFEQASRTMTLIIKFNSQKVVSDFNSMHSSF